MWLLGCTLISVKLMSEKLSFSIFSESWIAFELDQITIILQWINHFYTLIITSYGCTKEKGLRVNFFSFKYYDIFVRIFIINYSTKLCLIFLLWFNFSMLSSYGIERSLIIGLGTEILTSWLPHFQIQSSYCI